MLPLCSTRSLLPNRMKLKMSRKYHGRKGDAISVAASLPHVEPQFRRWAMPTEVDAKQAQWQKMFGYILGNQAAWIADIGLKAGLFRAIAEAGEKGITEEALA